MSKYIVFDVETTGLPKNFNNSPKLFNLWPRIVQFSWIIVDNEKIKEKSYIVKPENYIIPLESTKIHNISNKEAILNGIELEKVLHYFEEDCKNTNLLIAHNAKFDTNIILSSCYKINKDVDFIKNKKIICTMKNTTKLCSLPGKYGFKYPKLQELYFFLFNKNPTEKLHNSLEDSRVTLKCYKKLLEMKLI